MKKNIVWIVIGIVVVLLGLLALSGYRGNEDESDVLPGNDSDETVPALAVYFQNELFNRAVAKTEAIPIEGYDPELLMGPFPGFEPSDFDGVEAFEGYYTPTEEGLVFVRDREQPITSAERTISTKGYATLLERVAGRLDISVASEADIDALITTLEEQ